MQPLFFQRYTECRNVELPCIQENRPVSSAARISATTLFPAGLDYARDHFASNLPERFIPARKSRTRATFGRPAIQPVNRICISTRHAAVFFLLPVVCPLNKSRLLLRNNKLHIDTARKKSLKLEISRDRPARGGRNSTIVSMTNSFSQFERGVRDEFVWTNRCCN